MCNHDVQNVSAASEENSTLLRCWICGNPVTNVYMLYRELNTSHYEDGEFFEELEATKEFRCIDCYQLARNSTDEVFFFLNKVDELFLSDTGGI